VAHIYLFADEAGNFDFSRKRDASIYFILCTLTCADPSFGHSLLELRRTLAWEGLTVDRHFHATEDKQSVRDRVYGLIANLDVRIDATILEKPKAQDHLRNETALYRMAWFLHAKFVSPKIAKRGDRLFVAAASLGTRSKRAAMRSALEGVVKQTTRAEHCVGFWPMASDPCLWAADYATWAIQRMVEGGDDRSFVLIKDKVQSLFKPFKNGPTLYY
jgi:hypothetical protein